MQNGRCKPLHGGTERLSKNIMNYPNFWQKDLRWAKKILGFFNGTTIGSHGCLLSCLAMLCKFWGHDTDPGRLGDQMKGLGLFWKDEVLYQKINKVYSDIEFYGRENYFSENKIDWGKRIMPTPIDKIEDHLPVIALVDLNGAKKLKDTHFVVLWEPRGQDDFFISEPYEGRQLLFSWKYGKPETGIFGLRYFKKIMGEQIVKKLYNAIFHRDPDPEGLVFWKNKTIEQFLDGTMTGPEWKNFDPLFKAGKAIEEWGRSN